MNARKALMLVAAASVAAGVIAPAHGQEAKRRRGGHAWQTVLSEANLARANFNSVEFLNRHVGWAVGEAPAKTTVVYRTADGGATWERLPLFDGEPQDHYIQIRFVDADNGWILGTKRLLRSTDGGETWNRVPIPGLGFLAAKSLLVLGPETVVVGAQQGRVFMTRDAGRTWTQSLVVNLTYDRQVAGLAFAGATLVAVTAGPYPNAGPYGVYQSADGGASWEAVAESDAPLNAVEFYDDQRGLAVGDGAAYSTSDGGASWRRVAVPGKRFAVRFIDEERVVSVGVGPGVVISANGGITWRPMGTQPTPPITGARYTDLSIVDAGWWFVSGGFGNGGRGVFRMHDAYPAPLATSTVTIPVPVKIGEEVFPAGSYEVTVAHQDTTHVVQLELKEESGRAIGEVKDADSGRVTGTTADSATATNADIPKDERCDSCQAALPVTVEYAKEEAADAGIAPSTMKMATRGAGRFPLKISVEPTMTGLVLILDATLRPARDASIMLAALGVAAESSVSLKAPSAGNADGQKRSSGGALDRLKKAQQGDLRGALQGAVAKANPKAATERLEEARANAPSLYHVKVRYEVDVFRIVSKAAEKKSAAGQQKP